MESLLIACNIAMSSQLPLLVAIMFAGLLGSVSHCSVMCSPSVALHMLQLEEMHQPQQHMRYYHVGRISTYMGLGVVAACATGLLFSGVFQPVSGGMMMLAGSLFMLSALLPRQTHGCCGVLHRSLQSWLGRLNDIRLQYYLRGVLMGFMPCGMLLSVLLLVATTHHALYAAMLMAGFGISTLPALHGISKSVLWAGKKHPLRAAQIGRMAMAVNGGIIWLTGVSLIQS